jgi:hypothetical protein
MNYFPGKKYFPPQPDNSSEYKQTRPVQDSNFQNLLEIAAQKLGIQKEFTGIKICHEVRKMLVQIFPTAKPDQVFPISFADHTLTLGATASTWMHQLATKKPLIQQGINQKFGPQTVKKIIIKIKTPNRTN